MKTQEEKHDAETLIQILKEHPELTETAITLVLAQLQIQNALNAARKRIQS